MALDLNALRRLGFSRKQSQALAPALDGAATFTDIPVQSWLPYVWQGMSPRETSSGSTDFPIDQTILDAPSDWLDGPDIALVVDTDGATKYQVRTGGLYLVQVGSFDSTFRHDYGGGNIVAVDPSKILGSTGVQFNIFSPTWGTGLHMVQPMPINSGELNFSQTLYLPAGSILSLTTLAFLHALLDEDGAGPAPTIDTDVTWLIQRLAINLTRFAPAA